MDAESRPNVLLIVGSLRKQSLNRQLAQAAREILVDKATVNELEWADVPVFNQDIEYPAPQAVKRVRDAVSEADGIWIFSPEYNHGVPGGLKNLIDWLSRPVSVDVGAVIEGKPATVSSIAGGSCARYSQAALMPTFDFLKLQVAPVSFTSASFNRKEFTESVLDVSDAMKADLARQAQALLTKIQRA